MGTEHVPSWLDLWQAAVSTLWSHVCSIGSAWQMGGAGMKPGNDHAQPATITRDLLSPYRQVPIDIALSLLRPEELEKLRKYLASYLAKRHTSAIK
jgi:hypothetical protein